MKKVCKLSLSVAISLILTAGLFSCSDAATEDHKNESSEKVCSVGGKLDLGSALPSELVPSLYGAKNASRSATSSFETDLNYRLYAYHLKESQDVTGATVYEHESDEYQVGSVDKNEMTWSVVLNQIGKWEIEITLWHDFDNDSSSALYILRGTNIVSVDELDFGSSMECENVSLKPWADTRISGSINLEITVPEGITSVSFTSEEKDSNENLIINSSSEVTDSKATVSLSSIPAGTYNVKFIFHKEDGDCGVYICTERINVFSDFTTDTWYGTAPYFMQKENSYGGMDTIFVLTQEHLDSFKVPQTLASGEYPIVLWDLDYKSKKLEFEEPVSGYDVFKSVSEDAKIGDGFTLADGKVSEISAFAIDPVTQAVYTVEKDASLTSNVIVKYPSYAGYSRGKVVAELGTVSPNGFFVYEGAFYWFSAYWDSDESATVYTVNSFENGDVISFTAKDSEGNELKLTNISRIAVYDDYLYVAYRQSGDNYCVGLKKFSISGRTLTLLADVVKTVTELGIYGTDAGDYAMYSESSLSVNDIHVKSDGTEVYVIVSNHSYNYSKGEHESRGGIIRITDSGTSLTFHDFKAEGATASVWIYGWTYGACHPVTDTSETYSDSKYFYGCKKVIARKPDELVIADEGGYRYTDENNESKTVNKNRVVKVNLETFAMSAVDVNAGFDDYVADCGYGNYAGSNY